jgi:hypothetical protein
MRQYWLDIRDAGSSRTALCVEALQHGVAAIVADERTARDRCRHSSCRPRSGVKGFVMAPRWADRRSRIAYF